MERQEAIDILAEGRGDAISVATMQSVFPWQEAGQSENLHVDASQCMGSASSIALGLALARPDRKVMVLDGDGSLLMQLGSLVTIAGAAPANLYHFVFANGLHQSTGNQPLPAQGVFDWCAMASAAGYRKAVRIEQAEDLIEQLPGVWETPGPVLVELVIAREETEPRWAGVPMAGQVVALKASLAADR
ncbi:MAG: thiamine pyrophosphate-binding protein [Chloroflexi bacterium]|nr:thiamine pyrophosphate-binding protein [Chloroflexota bacterium]